MVDVTFYGVDENEEVVEWIEENLGGSEYNVYNEDSREEEVRDYIKESAWAFSTWFILDHASESASGIGEDRLAKIQAEECEGCNDYILSLIEDFDEFVDDAVGADGYGHFLSNYDGEENEVTIDGETYYIYRQN